MRIGVIGAGHAGVEAALSGATAGAQVVLFSSEQQLPYFRPRIVGLAFGQVDNDAIRMHPGSWYQDKGISLQLDTEVGAVDLQTCSVRSRNEEQMFDGLVIAAGAGPATPAVSSSATDCAIPLWTACHADRIRARLKCSVAIAVVGGGAIGIEAALRAVACGLQAVIIERASGLMAGRLVNAAHDVLMRRLVDKGVRVLAGANIRQMKSMAGGRTLIETDHGELLDVGTAIISAGSRVDVGLAQRAGLTTGAGITVDDRLRTSDRRVFACGDIACVDGTPSRTAGEAVLQGRIAGTNLCTVLSGGNNELMRYIKPVETISLKVGDFEMHLAGRPQSRDPQIQILEGSDDFSCRALLLEHDRPVAVQMVGSNLDFRKYVELIRAASVSK